MAMHQTSLMTRRRCALKTALAMILVLASAPGQATEFTPKTLSPLKVLYVDDDALHDPGPNDLTWSDPSEDGSLEHPFDSIQQAIDVAREHAEIRVSPGRYRECLDFRGKTLQVDGFELSHQAMTSYPIIDAGDRGVAVTFDQGETADCRLSGFVLTRGLGSGAGAITCIGSSPTIQNCLIVGNRCMDGPGVITCEDSQALFENCTIADNYGGKGGAGISLIDCNIVVSQSIVWGNMPEQIQVVSGQSPQILNSCVDEDPLFALSGYWSDADDSTLTPIEPNDPDAQWMEGDYHVRSVHGRYDLFAKTWAYDDITSNCIDLGDPARAVPYETAPHGDRINAGAYGASWMASRTGNLMFVPVSDPGFEGDMGKYEITNAQYCRFLNEALGENAIVIEGGRVYDASDVGRSRAYLKTAVASSASHIAYSDAVFEVITKGGRKLAHHPVVNVSWYGATAFAQWYGLRLPTSPEWRAVADFDGSYVYGCGTTIDPNMANFGMENPSGLPSKPYTTPVGSYPAYGYGLCDMTGNVWEWTSSRSSRFRILLSGSWTDLDIFCTIASQSGFDPGYILSNLGFRVCR